MKYRAYLISFFHEMFIVVVVFIIIDVESKHLYYIYIYMYQQSVCEINRTLAKEPEKYREKLDFFPIF